jgi:hypothetical protein
VGGGAGSGAQETHATVAREGRTVFVIFVYFSLVISGSHKLSKLNCAQINYSLHEDLIVHWVHFVHIYFCKRRVLKVLSNGN